MDNICMACKKGIHPLYTYQTFTLSPYEIKKCILRGNGYCFNCLNKGRISKQCPSSQLCQKYLLPHHTWLHNEQESNTRKPTMEPSETVTSHNLQLTSPQQQVLFMTCQLRGVTSNGHVTKARVLLDSTSSTSLIMERLAQHLRLPHIHCSL